MQNIDLPATDSSADASKSGPRVSLRIIRNIVVTALILTVTFTVGYQLGNQEKKLDPVNVTVSRDVPNDLDLNFSLFWDVWDTLSDQYFDSSKIDESKLIYGAIKGMVSAVGDPYTVFLTPNENKVTREDLSGNFEGVGIQIGFRGTQLAVIAPLPGTPAEEAGVKAGDLIIGITDVVKEIERGTRGISLPEAVQIIRGPADSTVTLTLIREGEDAPLEIDVVRRSIDVPSIVLNFVGENEDVAHVRLLKFGGETKNEWNETVREILKRPSLSGIIIDLRNNPGGFLQGAIDIGSDFLEVGDVVVIEENGSGKRDEYNTSKLGRLTAEKVTLLVNGGSASASEILSGALRDNNNTQIIGEKTFGKGTIQEPQQLRGGEGLHITIAKWLTPNGVWVNKEGGLTPDIEVEDDPETSDDEQLDRAVEYILNI